MPKVGERFLGTVVKTAAFGAFVSLLPGKDGLVHISKLGRGKRIGKVEDVVNVGDKLQVEIAEIDQRGKISLVLVDDDAATAKGGGTDGASADALRRTRRGRAAGRGLILLTRRKRDGKLRASRSGALSSGPCDRAPSR